MLLYEEKVTTVNLKRLVSPFEPSDNMFVDE